MTTMVASVVYFVLDREMMLMKVGYTTNVMARLQALQSGNGRKLDLIGTLRGGRDEESFLHRAMSALRVRGEWHAVTDDIVQAIRTVCDAEERDELTFALELSKSLHSSLET